MEKEEDFQQEEKTRRKIKTEQVGKSTPPLFALRLCLPLCDLNLSLICSLSLLSSLTQLSPLFISRSSGASPLTIARRTQRADTAPLVPSHQRTLTLPLSLAQSPPPSLSVSHPPSVTGSPSLSLPRPLSLALSYSPSLAQSAVYAQRYCSRRTGTFSLSLSNTNSNCFSSSTLSTPLPSMLNTRSHHSLALNLVLVNWRFFLPF
ncbi:hypothetical protein CKAN_01882500 [Cinnamomum micranthum f. kanehirae]|uniref:Uncharacterized protein n=1 Tax=Cinnamomum micranthum f. kanehirae TaxID=337451 RepID=A0A443PG51_9MAGN|nr:hypothetical protein CKAN_01882500 [Cinnamomum micranthum f. kanehirae]